MTAVFAFHVEKAATLYQLYVHENIWKIKRSKLCKMRMDSQPKIPISTPFLQQRLLRVRSRDDEVLTDFRRHMLVLFFVAVAVAVAAFVVCCCFIVVVVVAIYR